MGMGDETKMIRITACGETKEFPCGTTYEEIALSFADKVPDEILLVKENGVQLRELGRRAVSSCDVELITIRDKEGEDTYKRSLCLMMLKACFNVLGPDVHVWTHFIVSGGLFCTIKGLDKPLTQELLDRVKEEMKKLQERALPIEKRTISTREAVRQFTKMRMYDKAKLFNYRISSKTNVYSLSGFQDYYYGYMVKDSSCLKVYDLKLFEDGFVLMYPDKSDPEKVAAFEPATKLFHVQNSSRIWGEKLEIETVGDLNELIAAGETKQLMLMQEALQEKEIAEIAEEIAGREEARIVLIAGPSSSGKTTFSYRLSTQLSCYGLKPHPIAMDNYFVNRVDNPKNPDGSYDFECIEAIDIDLFNKNMSDLLAGNMVDLPTFNFVTGEREYKGNRLQLGKNGVLVIEGIHGLNEKLSYSIPHDKKFKVYISALTQLNVDEHNRIPTTDGRLLRRIVRDERTRGSSAQRTISMWSSVRKGEEQNIFPFQGNADVMFNSALIYELAVLKTYAVPILYSVPKDSPQWTEANRLLKFLDYFLPIPADVIPKNSLVREFIGGGIFGL